MPQTQVSLHLDSKEVLISNRLVDFLDLLTHRALVPSIYYCTSLVTKQPFKI